MRIPIADLLPIFADIDDQIVALDLMLVEQSNMVVAYYPCHEDGAPIYSAGREREIQYARDNGRYVYLIWPSKTKEPGPFEMDRATAIFRSVDEARDALIRMHS
jgi:hypothetical protein